MHISHEPGFLSKTIPRNKKQEEQVKKQVYVALREEGWKRMPWYLKIYHNLIIVERTCTNVLHLWMPNLSHYLMTNPLYFITMIGAL